ncbi:MAG: DLW-39 family protein [Sporichthyaceae bacterium]
MKKLLVATLAAVGGALAFKKMKAGKDEQDLWAEATDPVR